MKIPNASNFICEIFGVGGGEVTLGFLQALKDQLSLGAWPFSAPVLVAPTSLPARSGDGAVDEVGGGMWAGVVEGVGVWF